MSLCSVPFFAHLAGTVSTLSLIGLVASTGTAAHLWYRGFSVEASLEKVVWGGLAIIAGAAFLVLYLNTGC